ncbi:T9SS type A sorting domain-containing protein [bacterium]|nr:T9SS type A sorting domain-containing protein [bacterium]
MSLKSIIIVLILIVSSILFADGALEYAGSGIWSGFEAIASPGGDYIYTGFPYGLGVFDVSDSLDCFITDWKFLGGQVSDIVIAGNIAYLAAGDVGLAIIDITDPTDISLVSTLEIGEFAKGIDVSGDIVIIAGSAIGICIIDVSTLSAPVQVGSYNLSGGCMDVVTDGNIAYICRGLGGFSIVDFSTPSSPSLLDSYSSSTLIRECAKYGNYIFLAAELTGLTILDVTDPASITVYGTYPAPTGRALDCIDIQDDVAYVGAGNYGVLSLDITDPASITLIDRYPMSTTSVIRVSIDGGILYFSTSEGLQVLDVGTSPTSMTFVSRQNLHSGIECVWGSGSKLLTSSGIYGMDGFNMPTPYNPLNTFNFTNGNRFYAALYYNHYIFAAEASDGLGILRSNSLAEYPDPIRMMSIGGIAKRVMRVDTLIYVMTSIGVTQLKILNPEEPIIFWDAPIDDPGAFYATQDYIYVCNEDDGFIVLETGMMTEIGRDDSADDHEYVDLTVSGNYAYAAAGSDGLLIFDISDPTSPELVKEIDTSDDAEGIATANGWLYVAIDRNGVVPFKIEDVGDSLTQYDDFVTGGRSKGIYANGNYVFVADRYAVMVLRNTVTDIQENLFLPQAANINLWPNPFNSACYIETPFNSVVKIYDSVGHLVAELPAELNNNGLATWRPSPQLSSGNYLIRAKNGNSESTGKAIYIK